MSGETDRRSRLARVEAIFNECVALPAAEHRGVLAARCGDDAALRDEVAALLAHDARPEPSALAQPRPLPAAPPAIGPYRLLEKLGEGGFGEVFAAEQSEPVRRRVAVKLLKPGMDSRAVLARFEAERHALALMDHPSVARVLDAGATQEGRPYFVMELVIGESITAFCERGGMPVRERLGLFIAVCRAVEHAHQKGVIHRDLKPSNILVTTADGKPLPKVIDFGIAKATETALAGETLHTRAGEFLGTPEYMSPEHAESGGADVDTRADVYALGAILYRVLTGCLPFESEKLRGAGISQIQRILREDEPPRPSVAARAGDRDATAVARELSGDIDWIVGRAMEKDRARRYASAAALADDIERHLRDEPVLAGPPSTLYRVGKLMRRHRALVAGGAAVVATLVIGIAATTTQAVRARHAESEARRAESEARTQAQIATAVNSFLTDMLGEANPETNPRGGEVTARELVDRAARLLEDETVKSPRVGAALHHALATTYMGLARFDEAEPHLRRAIEVRRAEAGDRSEETIESLIALADLEMRRRRYTAAESLFAAIGGAGDALPPSSQRTRARYLRLRGANLAVLERLSEADSLLTAALALERESGAHDDGLWASLTERARLQQKLRHLDEAEALAREALEIVRGQHKGDHANLGISLGVLAGILNAKGNFAEGERLFREEYEMTVRIFGPSHPSAAIALGGLGVTVGAAGRNAEAEGLLREAISLFEASVGADNEEAANVRDNLALALQDQGKYDEALELRLGVLETMRRLYGRSHLDSARSLNNLGTLYRLMGRHDEAQDAFEEARSLFRERLGDEHAMTVTATNNIGKALLDQGRAAAAESMFTAALAGAARAFPAGHPNIAAVRANHGRALAAMGRRKEAEAEFLGAFDGLSAGLGAKHPRTREVAQDLARLYERWGRSADIARWRRAAEPAT